MFQVSVLGSFRLFCFTCKTKIERPSFQSFLAMSKAFNDPSLLTKDRLKKELESRGVKLPRGDQKKEFYVRLYRETVSRETISINGEFSSDDDTESDQSPQNKVLLSAGEDMPHLQKFHIVKSLLKYGVYIKINSCTPQ